MMTEQATLRHLKSTLHRVRTLLGRPLNQEETATVLVTLMGWTDLLASGMPPEQVTAMIKAETEASTLH